ncbi:MAG: ExbD/TolR family protein [Thermodesulfobacteriota bacterium]
MRFIRGRREEEPRLGIAPLIDIVFLLLIFFMVTSHFDLASGVRLQLPEMVSRLSEEPRKEATVVIDREGNTYLEGEPVEKEKLEERFRKRVQSDGLERIILQADKDARHGSVLGIIDLARAAGVRSVIIAARWKSGQDP